MAVKQIISGSWLTAEELVKRFPSIIYIVILTVIYIYNIFDTQHQYRELVKLQSEISRLQVTATTTQSNRVSITRESNIINEIKTRNLPIFETKIPPKTVK